MPELISEREIQARLRFEVKTAGGAKKWLRKHKITGHDHVEHMISDGRAATFPDVMRALGFQRVVLFESSEEDGGLG